MKKFNKLNKLLLDKAPLCINIFQIPLGIFELKTDIGCIKDMDTLTEETLPLAHDCMDITNTMLNNYGKENSELFNNIEKEYHEALSAKYKIMYKEYDELNSKLIVLEDKYAKKYLKKKKETWY